MMEMINPPFPAPFLPLLMILQQELAPRCSLWASDKRTLLCLSENNLQKNSIAAGTLQRNEKGAQSSDEITSGFY